MLNVSPVDFVDSPQSTLLSIVFRVGRKEPNGPCCAEQRTTQHGGMSDRKDLASLHRDSSQVQVLHPSDQRDACHLMRGKSRPDGCILVQLTSSLRHFDPSRTRSPAFKFGLGISDVLQSESSTNPVRGKIAHACQYSTRSAGRTPRWVAYQP
jgi:hypothetical protein